ncbi:hypothetical protein CSA37_09505 [Candidatus Fermentibacteria bacterium]|nr:MAG: hypothetical protein CSA37_09505 [Candidatus Fermentibacteria bacterium]
MLSFAIGLALISLADSSEQGLRTVQVFHKNMPPSLQTLEQVEAVLAEFQEEYQITYHVITDTASEELISLYGLPDTHFPFAVVVNGHFSALIDGAEADFVHFPLFMHGIGRHEGNWSLEQLRMVLEDNSLLLEENVLPVIEDDSCGCETECAE